MTRELSLAVVGLGFGANHARILGNLDGVRLAAVCDADRQRLESFSRDRDLNAYTELETMLHGERLDAVVIAVPASLHLPIALQVIEAGCAVLIEKPLAPTYEDGRHLVEAAATAGVPLMAGHLERFNAAIQEMARRVQAGDVGRVIQISARRLAYFPDRSRDVDIGVVHDLAYHDIDSMRYVLGAEVVRVSAEAHSDVRTPYEDALAGLLRFEDLQGRPGPIGTLEVNRISTRKVRELSVIGERGLLVASYADFRSATLEFQPSQALEGSSRGPTGESSRLHLRGDEPGPVTQIELKPHEPLAQELSAFVNSLRHGTPMLVTGEDALAALAIADAITESARLGEAVVPRTTRP
jgi:UDP-N-acetylglucosamine 3-dehydrogenase